MKSHTRILVALSLSSFCQCAHQEPVLDSKAPLIPSYQPPPLIIGTAPDDAAEFRRRAEVEQKERTDSILSFIFDGVSEALFGTDEDRREKRWEKSRKRKILVKKGYLEPGDGPPPEGFPSQF